MGFNASVAWGFPVGHNPRPCQASVPPPRGRDKPRRARRHSADPSWHLLRSGQRPYVPTVIPVVFAASVFSYTTSPSDFFQILIRKVSGPSVAVIRKA